MVAVDTKEIRDFLLFVAVMGRGVESFVHAALGVDAARCVTAHLEREHACHVRLEGERLEVEH